MKTVAAKEAQNHFGQLINTAQLEAVTIEKNGLPVAVVMSMDEYHEHERLKLQVLRHDLAEAEQQINEGRAIAFTQDVAERIKENGRAILNQEKK
jgi:prevent-host-death family protein